MSSSETSASKTAPIAFVSNFPACTGYYGQFWTLFCDTFVIGASFLLIECFLSPVSLRRSSFSGMDLLSLMHSSAEYLHSLNLFIFNLFHQRWTFMLWLYYRCVVPYDWMRALITPIFQCTIDNLTEKVFDSLNLGRSPRKMIPEWCFEDSTKLNFYLAWILSCIYSGDRQQLADWDFLKVDTDCSPKVRWCCKRFPAFCAYRNAWRSTQISTHIPSIEHGRMCWWMAIWENVTCVQIRGVESNQMANPWTAQSGSSVC